MASSNFVRQLQTAAGHPEIALVTRPPTPFDAGADGIPDFDQLSTFGFELSKL
jgi:hypothetical protein